MASQTSSSSKHIFSVPRGVWIHANYIKPQFPASKWRGGERCSDCEKLTKEGTDPYKALMAYYRSSSPAKPTGTWQALLKAVQGEKFSAKTQTKEEF